MTDNRRTTLDLPTDVHLKLKLLAVQSGKSMRELVLDWIREKLNLPKSK